jgi:hypothetical protein
MHRVEPVVVLPVKVSKLLEKVGGSHEHIITKNDYFTYGIFMAKGRPDRR